MEKVTPDAPGFEYAGRKFLAAKLWAPAGAGNSKNSQQCTIQQESTRHCIAGCHDRLGGTPPRVLD
jgi:hypothetical protein